MKPKTERKFIKHTFTDEERLRFGANLGQAIATARNIESDFNTIKAQFKLKTEEAKNSIDILGTKLQAGYEMREADCLVIYDADNRKKRYYLKELPEYGPVLEEPMTSEDYQQDLIIADSLLENVTEIEIFPQAGNDHGVIVVGKNGENWFNALRIKVGDKVVSEKLNSEQQSAKKRADAIRKGAKRAKEWFIENLGKDAFEGFKAMLETTVRTNEEVVE